MKLSNYDGNSDKDIISAKIKQVQKIELEMLVEINRICSKYGINYSLDSGSLLGIIRNKGFIPWDDDIDIVMLRDDYNKFVSIATKEFKYPLFFQSAYTDDSYFRGHCQIRNSNTTAIIHGEGPNVKFNQGIFVDIFPLDYSSKFKVIEFLRHINLRIRMKIMRIKYMDNSPKLLKLIFYKKNIQKEYKKYEKVCQRVLFKSNKVDKISYYLNLKKYKYFDDYYFKNFIYKDFENVKVSISKEYDAILRTYYGNDYMTPKRSTVAHGDLIIDTTKSYKEIVDLMRKGIFDENDRL